MTYTTLHGLAGAKYIRQHFHIQDQQIISAVANHVIPSLRPTTLDKIIYCADKLEPARSNNDADNIKSLRQLAFTNIGAAFNTLLTQIQKRYR
jgi:nicotinate-nucleotide adenylyltransferase